MEDKIKKASTLLHSIANRMVVIDHLLNFYAKHLPENKMTNIGLKSIKELKEEILEIKSLVKSLNEPSNKNVVSIEEWKNKFISQKDKLSEMSIFHININETNFENKNNYINPVDLDTEIGLYFEEIAMTGATEMNINITSNPSIVRISFCDNGDGSTDLKSTNLLELKDRLGQKDINAKLQAMPGVGSNLILDIKIAN